MEARCAPHDDDDTREGSTKRARVMVLETGDEDQPQQDYGDHAAATTQCSVQEFLSVPLHIIFRRQDGGGRRRHKPLMTRAEAHTLLTITELAGEMDILFDLSSQALERKLQSQMIRSDIQDIPTFRSLVPSLVVHGQHIPQQALVHLESELDRVLACFEACSLTLKQFSEQNWTMSDSLLDAFGQDDVRGQALAKEKRGLSDLEEELSKRLEHFSDAAAVASKVVMFGDYDQDDLSMAILSNRMFGIKETPALKLSTSLKKRAVAANANVEMAASTADESKEDLPEEESKEDLPEEEMPQAAPSLLEKHRSMAAAVDKSKEDLPEEETPQATRAIVEKGSSMAATVDKSEEDRLVEIIPEETLSQTKTARSLATAANNNDETADPFFDTSTIYPPEEEVPPGQEEPQQNSQPVPEKARSFAPTSKIAVSAKKSSPQRRPGAEVTGGTNTAVEVEGEEHDDDASDGQGSTITALQQGSPRKAETARILGSLLSEQCTDTNSISDDQQLNDGTDDHNAFDHHEDQMDDETQPLPDSIANTQTAVTALAGLTHSRN